MMLSLGLAQIWLKMNFAYALLGLIGLLGVILVLQLIFRPYKSKIDNFGIDLNVGVAFLFFVFIFLQNNSIIESSDSKAAIFRYGILGGLVACCLTSIIRLVRAFSSKFSE